MSESPQTLTLTDPELTPEANVIQSLFFILSKSGEQRQFLLNAPQRKYDQKRTRRDIIPKARQEGFSSLGIAYQTVDCLGKYGTRAVLISHEARSTQRLLDRAGYYIRNLRNCRAELGRHSRNEFFFPETESTYYIGTAGAKAFGRGDTINHLHISEYAWWESDALKQVAGLFQAVPLDGTIRIESTGRGRLNDFYYLTTHAEQMGYNVTFFAWWENPEYALPIPQQGYTPEGFEDYFDEMRERYSLSDEQLYFYWIKLLEFRLDLRYMQQEYPSSLEECFQATGGAVFPDLTRVHSEYWQYRLDRIEGVKQSTRVEYLSTHPRDRRTYVIGADPSGGTGNDEAALQILCLETLEQVLELGSNQIDPVVFAHVLAKLGLTYNEAFIVCEANSFGIATHSVLKDIYPTFKIFKRALPSRSGMIRYGYVTTEESKKALIGAILQLVDDGLSLHGIKTLDELAKFEEDPETGKLGAPEDGLVIALGMAAIGYYKYQRFAYRDLEQPPKPLSIDYEHTSFMFTSLDDMLTSIDKQNRPKHGPFPSMLRR